MVDWGGWLDKVGNSYPGTYCPSDVVAEVAAGLQMDGLSGRLGRPAR